MKPRIDLIFRIIIILIAFILLVYFSVAISGRLTEWRDYFIRAGNYWDAVAIILFAFGLGKIVDMLWRWGYRHESGITKEQREAKKHFRRRWR